MFLLFSIMLCGPTYCCCFFSFLNVFVIFCFDVVYDDARMGE